MFPKINPTKTAAWKALIAHQSEMKKVQMKDLFEQDRKRFENMSILFGDILFDYSKNIVTDKTLEKLLQLADDCKLKDARKAMFAGEHVNETEDRAVLHTALRNFSDQSFTIDGDDIMPEIRETRQKMKAFCEKIHSGEWKGYSGKKIKNIVNIGIGGSDLGPVMVTEALRPYWMDGIQAHFVSNVDGTQIVETLKNLNPEETLFTIASKTFTTQETMTNAHTAREWFLNSAKDKKYIEKHFVALSTNKEGVEEFGIAPENMFVFWDWVGGRYSLWSSIGLSIALTIGYSNFEQLLKGAEATDHHFRTADFKENIPVIMALIGIWYTNFFGSETEAILPYDQYMHRFPAYFQQGNMESNGKHTDRNGKRVPYSTGPIVWGEPGTNGQHAFYQLIHQGSDTIPCEFLIAAEGHEPELAHHHDLLVANCLAQSAALMRGRDLEAASAGIDPGLAPHKVFPGNRPSTTLIYRRLDPATLGRIIALHEHRVFVEGTIWGINSFDQW